MQKEKKLSVCPAASYGLLFLFVTWIAGSTQPVAAQGPVFEDFSTDDIGSGDWIASDASVYVDESNGWLRIGTNGAVDDFADKYGPFPLPLVIEWRERTFTGAGSYFSLPKLELWWGPASGDSYTITYVQDDQSGNPADDGWLFGSWTNVHTLGPAGWDQWRTVRAIIRSDGGELFAKQDGDLDFTAIATATWAIPNVIERLRLAQNSDDVSEFDYVHVKGAVASPWCDDFSTDPLSGNWTTNSTGRYHWDAATGTLFTDNYTNSGEWAAVPIAYDAESFVLSFDLLPIRATGETGDITFGLLGPSKISNGAASDTEERLFVLFGGYLSQIYVEGWNVGGEHFYSGAGSGLLQDGVWHHVALSYDAASNALSIEITRGGSPILTWQTMMSYGFSGNLVYLGTSMVGHWVESNRHAIAYIDDVCLSTPVTRILAEIDIKPGSCPNPLNLSGRDGTDAIITTNNGDETTIGEYESALKAAPVGSSSRTVIPVAVLGTDELDVFEIDRAGIALEGVPPIRWAFEDVSTPMPVDATACECNTLGPDGIMDLTLKFDKAAIIAALGSVSDGDVVPLTLAGELMDGTPIEGQDCVVIRIGGSAQGLAVNDPTLPALGSCYPNPFNPSTSFSIYLPEHGSYSLTIYNITGQTVRTFEGHGDAGVTTVTWDGTDRQGTQVASGVYLYRMRAGEFVDTKRMVLLK